MNNFMHDPDLENIDNCIAEIEYLEKKLNNQSLVIWFLVAVLFGAFGALVWG